MLALIATVLLESRKPPSWLQLAVVGSKLFARTKRAACGPGRHGKDQSLDLTGAKINTASANE
jgi:hypothetical protein